MPNYRRPYIPRGTYFITQVTYQRVPWLCREVEQGERNLWQRRYWEHWIRDEQDFAAHCDYIHYNLVKHGLCKSPQDWPFSSVHRFIEQGIYPSHWCREQSPGLGDRHLPIVSFPNDFQGLVPLQNCLQTVANNIFIIHNQNLYRVVGNGILRFHYGFAFNRLTRFLYKSF